MSEGSGAGRSPAARELLGDSGPEQTSVAAGEFPDIEFSQSFRGLGPGQSHNLR